MRAVFALCLWSLTAAPVWANAQVTVLMEALRLPELLAALRDEGLRDAEDLNRDMLRGQGGAFWQEQISTLYQTQAMDAAFYQALTEGMDDDDLAAAVAFFDSDRGQRITGLEIAARQAMADPAVEEAAAAAFAALPEGDALGAVVAGFAEVNDLLELNVALTMSTSYRFSKGLADGDLLEIDDAAILAQVWESEDALRASAETWLTGYLMLAQQPLPLADAEAYLAFARSDAGQALNAALFQGYETVFRDIAYGLGRAVALNATTDDI
ncbi:DUF2059 domain-containing protein [uncultured Roseobacter sp.]|uniref:DUF2059 domain-containing protein n=1 Tax=uncultured Roseobacter sp. TaxID=114847 RepID=UPI00260CA473|nr:DUF2059 domain-containing protein [uncultured Roseobacter sp.]